MYRVPGGFLEARALVVDEANAAELYANGSSLRDLSSEVYVGLVGGLAGLRPLLGGIWAFDQRPPWQVPNRCARLQVAYCLPLHLSLPQFSFSPVF